MFKKLSFSGEITQLLGPYINDSAFRVFQNGINHGPLQKKEKKRKKKEKN